MTNLTPREAFASGPRKERPRSAPEPQFSTHKSRSAWFQAREAWPVREAPIQTLIRERSRVRTELETQPGDVQWQSVGPSNIGGRMTSLVCHPEHPELLIAGAAGGGVWRSTDGGRNWTPQWHDQPTLNIGSVALDPSDPNIVYCGTGEANLSLDLTPASESSVPSTVDSSGKFLPLPKPRGYHHGLAQSLSIR
jgi:hypothetical protein